MEQGNQPVNTQGLPDTKPTPTPPAKPGTVNMEYMKSIPNLINTVAFVVNICLLVSAGKACVSTFPGMITISVFSIFNTIGFLVLFGFNYEESISFVNWKLTSFILSVGFFISFLVESITSAIAVFCPGGVVMVLFGFINSGLMGAKFVLEGRAIQQEYRNNPEQGKYSFCVV